MDSCFDSHGYLGAIAKTNGINGIMITASVKNDHCHPIVSASDAEYAYPMAVPTIFFNYTCIVFNYFKFEKKTLP